MSESCQICLPLSICAAVVEIFIGLCWVVEYLVFYGLFPPQCQANSVSVQLGLAFFSCFEAIHSCGKKKKDKVENVFLRAPYEAPLNNKNIGQCRCLDCVWTEMRVEQTHIVFGISWNLSQWRPAFPYRGNIFENQIHLGFMKEPPSSLTGHHLLWNTTLLPG